MPRPKHMAKPYLKTTMEQSEAATKKKKIIEIFKKYDANGDGQIDRQELLNILSKCIASVGSTTGTSLCEEQCDLILDAADANKDGKISFAEFVGWAYSKADAEDSAEVEDQNHRIVISSKTLLPQKYNVDISKSYAMDKCQIGEGGYGKVFVAKDPEFENRLVAVKRVTKTHEAQVDALFYKEIEIMQALDHPNICKLLEFYEVGSTVYFVMEYCQGGELFDRIAEFESLTESLAADIIAQLVAALRYAHARSIAHRDLKPENIVFCSEKAEDTHVKLIDWGLGMSFANCRMCDPVGSHLYMAPEVASSNSVNAYTQSCDVWSLGVLSYVALTGQQPFWGPPIVMKAQARNEKYPVTGEHYAGLSEQCKDFICSLLKADPAKRPDMETVASHPWLICAKEKTSAALDKSRGSGVLKNLKQFRGASNFSALCITAVARQLDHSQLGDVHQVFKSMDKNGDGVLSIEEVTNGFLEMMGADSPTYKEMLETFKSLDLDGSNAIDYTEFCAGGVGQTGILKDEACMGAFKMFDLDNSDTLCPSELQQVLESADLKKAWGSSTCKSVAETILADYDADGDGLISYPEFRSLLKHASEEAVQKSAQMDSKTLNAKDIFDIAL
eukprot:gnl/MRDRNA2_/MRDRNA2_101188_c0_seq1.p1 gnl/MRDRNA2_/MRDRNA2_101188_c0~~gnl/MRDRNA2_/MRDRNA2_101188_c0_seq1.p1  ORF type:complete len:617 (+),score=134.07 gnl/MRDRNA2_/MRDRNA2_101188_c0_seq1:78-1928(+)